MKKDESIKANIIVDSKKPIVTDKDSLIPIKGIDVQRRNYLNQMGIFTADDLLQQGRTKKQRKIIATKLLNLEISKIKGNKTIEKLENIFLKYVTSWVKQADLRRVRGMDDNTAYFLVELGVRHVEDLCKVDPNKAYAMMQCLSNSQPDFVLVTLGKLTTLIDNAQNISNSYITYQKRLSSQLKNSLRSIKRHSNEFMNINKILSQIKIEDIIGGSTIEIDEPAPNFLFRDDENNSLVSDTVNSGDVIVKGLGFLQEVELTLPLPKTICGTVYMLKNGEELPKDKNSRNDYAFNNALVEIDGITSPSTDKTENNNKPKSYTDSKGNFIIILPDKYNMQEAINITISQGINKQTFVLSASDIINHVDKQKVLKYFDDLDRLHKDFNEDQEKLDFIINIENNQTSENFILNEKDQIRFNELLPKKESIKKEKDLLEKQINKLEELICASDNTTNDLERILRNLLYCSNLVADFKEEPFILNETIFKNTHLEKKKILPSVKLMENNNETVYLPTDTAPSRIFTYSMLQRLVEPAISPLADMQSLTPRISLKSSVDVVDFKEKISTSPESWPQMSSLGIGYVLNMQQAWVPDGFALGNLLYSLILAPGEEQRLIVREKSQSYNIIDNFEGRDSTGESYVNSQIDNTTAAYEYALNQLSEGNSNYSYSTKTSSFGGGGSLGGAFGGISATLGLSGSRSSSSGKASSYASQSNAHNEVSDTAQNFQHTIKTTSEKISQANRLNISMATSEENDSAATRIIANHNHSHAMTIQYWEVMRRYRLETCVDSVDLVLFVPMKLINFLNGESYTLEDSSSMNRDMFNKRYEMLLKYSDALEYSVPNKYKTGLNLIRKYAACPNWKIEELNTSARFITLEFQGFFFSFDNITANLVLKNGKGSIAGTIQYATDKYELPVNSFETSRAIKEEIKKLRRETKNLNTCTCTFTVPDNITDDDLSYVRINYSCDGVEYVLYRNPAALALTNENANDLYQYMMDKTWDLVKDRKDTAADIRKINYCKEMLPEAWLFPNVTLSSNELKKLGSPIISNVRIYKNLTVPVQSNNNGNANSNDMNLIGMLSSSVLSSTVSVIISSSSATLRYSELQEMESTLHHVVSNTMRYSQAIWASLTSDERALLLEQYTIDMDFNKINSDEDLTNIDNEDTPIDIPLLNCINVKKLLGFYGNCMLFPFTYPEKLSKKIGKTAGELQDSLYRYHTNYFRVPSTIISLPTDGMIGEAVLGETNVSEKIDLTRFWNWKDSPIDNMEIDSSYLNNQDYLSGKTTKDFSPLNIQGATATTPVTAADLVSALVNKHTPTFDNITGLEQLKDILNTATNTTAKGREAALTSSNEIAKTALEYANKLKEMEVQTELKNLQEKLAKAEEELNRIKNNKGNNTNQNTLSEDLSNSSNTDLSLLKKILDEAIKSKNNGISSIDFFNTITENNLSKEEIMDIAKNYCLENGISFDDIIANNN
jgi:hypothetical protein